MEGGTLEGKVRATPFAGGIPFLAAVRAKDVAADEVISRVVGGASVEDGNLDGELTILGRLRDPSSYRGRGNVTMAEVRLVNSSILKPLSRAANVGALSEVEVNDIYAKFGVGGTNIGIEDLRASSSDITLAGRGLVGLRSGLRFALRLYISNYASFGVRAIERRLPQGASLGFVPYEGDAERLYRDYLITGMIQAPMINFWVPEQNVPIATLKEQFVEMLGTGAAESLPGSAD